MKKAFPNYIPLILMAVFVALVFRKTLLYGFIPAPFNLMTSTFFPYNNGGWQEEARPSPIKGGWYAIDAVRQVYPWKQLVLSQIEHAKLPLWNPHNFSGSPLLANIQSAVFYPFNILFILIPSFPYAWTSLLVTAVILSAWFMYLFLRSVHCSPTASLIGALAFTGSGQMIDWLEWSVITHTFIWLPLILFSINRFLEKHQKKYLLLFITSLVCLIFAGYPQRAAYTLLVVLTWLLFAFHWKNGSLAKHLRSLRPLLISVLLTLGITAVQWLPTAELYFHSAMRGKASESLSERASLPFSQLVTFIAPDYFGNRVTNNYWGKEVGGADYMDADMFFGVMPFLLFALSFLIPKKSIQHKTLLYLFFLGLALALQGPISTIIAAMQLPVLSTGAASEAGIISVFSGCALAAYGWDELVRRRADQRKLLFKPLLLLFLLFVSLFIITLFLQPTQALIARKNLLVPFTTFMAGALVLFILNFKKIFTRLVKTCFLILILAELIYHADKMLPFSSPKLAYPQHIFIEQVKKLHGYDRTAGFWETELNTNMETAFGLYSSEGYDPLYLRRYGEFMASAHEGKLTPEVPRADADLEQKNETTRNRVLDLTSTKYIIGKVTDPDNSWEQEPMKYDPERFNLIWQGAGFKLYENLPALPRVKLFSSWEILHNDEEIISRLYSPDFNSHETVVLDKDPRITETPLVNATAAIVRYEPNLVDIETQATSSAVLLLTDAYYPGWKATVDGKPAEIIRANYTFRAVEVPSGEHKVIFSYIPWSLIIGAIMSTFSLIFAALFIHTIKFHLNN